MKRTTKWMIMALALMLVCASAALAEEEAGYAQKYPESLRYDTNWACGGTLLEAYCEDDGFRVMIRQTTGDMMDEQLVWEYSPSYDPENGTLEDAAFGTKTHEAGEAWTVEYEDGAASFEILENGHLIWKDQKEDAGAGMEFVKIGRFEGEYQCDRAEINIVWDADDVYVIDVHWASSAFESTDWMFKGTYDPATDTIGAVGLATVYTYDEKGEFVSAEDVNEEGCVATFSFNDQGQLLWDCSDHAGDGLVFENLMNADDYQGE